MSLWIERFMNRHPALYRMGMRLALWKSPLEVERMIMLAFLKQTFGPEEAGRWMKYIERKRFDFISQSTPRHRVDSQNNRKE